MSVCVFLSSLKVLLECIATNVTSPCDCLVVIIRSRFPLDDNVVENSELV